ncbi:MAG: indole-3-glycerol phosphate synthase TrpC [Gemmatimonadota bacterium]|nr:MAG: indole-3-glycerol phosphate synthase TrpC [Gemmatimonadota bacterium]
MTILDEIVAHKRDEVARKRTQGQRYDLNGLPPTRDFASSLRGEGISMITEIKRCSPSSGEIRGGADPTQIATIYEKNGAAAISVLTDRKYFGGRDEFVALVKGVTDLPVLRKEFLIDPIQIYESRALGADAILLIASILDRTEINDFLNLAEEVGLSCLVEVHSEDDLEKVLRTKAQVIGINNRNLSTLTVDMTTSLRLKSLIPAGIITVSESGLKEREDILMLEAAAFDAVLIGESLMDASDIGAKLRELRGR